MTILDEVLARTDHDECWPWPGSRADDGYGKLSVGGRIWMAHRAAYAVAVGPIPIGYEVDHLCFSPSCVNPAHLEAVTPAENIRRRFARFTHCKYGHEYNSENTRYRGNRRACRICDRRKTAEYNARRRTK